MRRNFLYMSTVRNNVLMCLPATNKGWEWDIDFLHAVVGPGLSKNVIKPTMQQLQCGFILINEKLG